MAIKCCGLREGRNRAVSVREFCAERRKKLSAEDRFSFAERGKKLSGGRCRILC